MIPIQNIYYMLSYAFRALKEQQYRELATEEFQNTGDLMAAILAKGIAVQLKRGLEREYIAQTETLPLVKGKIDISESMKMTSVFRKQLVCTYDDFSENNRMNQIVKSTAVLLLKADISKSRKRELRKLIPFFDAVDSINLRTVRWDFRYNRNNQTYEMLISICFLIVKGLLQTSSDGTIKLMDHLDDQRMCRLYERFILEYYKKHYPGLKVSASQIPWALECGHDDMLPIMQSDIQLQRGGDVLIIDAKYYSSTTHEQFGKRTLHSDNLYQIFTYVKNREYQFKNCEHAVSGMLLYAKTDEVIQPDSDYQICGNRICVKTLDLSVPFSKIAKQMDHIVMKQFASISKEL